MMRPCLAARPTAQKLRAPARKCAIFAQSRCPAFIFMRENTQLANGQSPRFETGGAPALSRWNRQRPRQPAQFRRLTPNEDHDVLQAIPERSDEGQACGGTGLKSSLARDNPKNKHHRG